MGKYLLDSDESTDRVEDVEEKPKQCREKALAIASGTHGNANEDPEVVDPEPSPGMINV